MQNTIHLHRQASYQSQTVSTPAYLHSLWRYQVNWLTHYILHLILRSQSSSAREKVTSAWWLHLYIHNLHAWHIGMTKQVWIRLLRGGRFPNSSHAPLMLHATRGRPPLPGTPPMQNNRGFIVRWILDRWAAICI